jgi:DNA methylase
VSITLIEGDCRAALDALPAASVQTVITSPPYYGLRDYSTTPLVWDGEAAHAHEWGAPQRTPWANDVAGPSPNVPKNKAGHWRPKHTGPRCWCGAWLGSLGLEPTLELYVDHLVQVFRHIRRALRSDGTVWLNLGDSYASHDPGGWRGGEFLNPDGRQGPKAIGGTARNRAGTYRPAGLKNKDLLLVPVPRRPCAAGRRLVCALGHPVAEALGHARERPRPPDHGPSSTSCC